MSFDQNYFSSNTYEKVSFGRFSQYWWSNRFYAILARRYGKPGTRLLEIGSGLGHLSGQLAGSFITFLADINAWALRNSKRDFPGAKLINLSAEALPFKAESFELILMKHVVEHLQDPQRALEEINRVAAGGALLVFSTPNLSSLLRPWKGKQWIGFQDPTHVSLKEPEEWLRILKENGFKPLRIFSDGFWDVPYIRLLPSFLQKIIFGFPGGMQAILGVPFLPLRWGESMLVIARKQPLLQLA